MKPYRPLTLKAYLVYLGIASAAIFIVTQIAESLGIPLWARACMNLILGMAAGRIAHTWWKHYQRK
jgi:phosphate starvation-inducible membrane PsiE